MAVLICDPWLISLTADSREYILRPLTANIGDLEDPYIWRRIIFSGINGEDTMLSVTNNFLRFQRTFFICIEILFYITMPDHRKNLNNYLQKAYQNPLTLQWNTRQLGPEHDSDWEAIAFINHVEYGRGIARLLKDAKEEAARQVLVHFGEY